MSSNSLRYQRLNKDRKKHSYVEQKIQAKEEILCTKKDKPHILCI